MCPVQQCVQLISRAVRPVMLIGSQATLPPCDVDKLRSAVEVGMLTYTAFVASGQV